ncbi:hypothetical protein [Ligilactobacillus salivarius]|uniref:hypothetical protein n=1 Tax=Ligilactobacillus salivarius TaxID=1624 RepID=UPI003F24CFFD
MKPDTKIAEIKKYDLDEDTSELRSGDKVLIFTLINKIFRLKVILYSNPRWGSRSN